MSDFRDQDCIRLHMSSLASSVKEHAKEWIKTLGKLLQDSAKETLASLHKLLDVSVSYSTRLIFFLNQIFLNV